MNEIRVEDFDLVNVKCLIILENSNMYWDEVNYKFYLLILS